MWSDYLLYGIIELSGYENGGVHTKINNLCQLELEIYPISCFIMAAILNCYFEAFPQKIQRGNKQIRVQQVQIYKNGYVTSFYPKMPPSVQFCEYEPSLLCFNILVRKNKTNKCLSNVNINPLEFK